MTTDWLDLHEQFILCRDSRQIPDGWSSHAIRGWRLGHHPSLPVITLLAHDQVEVGWLLGYAINGKGLLLDSEAVTVPFAKGAEVAPGDFERWVYDHGGRFMVVLIAETGQRVYLDPCGSLSAVYCPTLECVASTVTVVPRDGDTGELTDLARLVDIPASFSMYPLHLTPRKNVWRLVPNHFLDLGQWQAVRHWPKKETFLVGDTTKAVNQVVERVRLHMGALVAKTPVLLRLTAGFDSRMLLACARPWVDRMTLYTAEHDPLDTTSWLDCSTARHIARDLGLRYMCLPHRRAGRDDLEQWLFRTGWSVGEPRGWRACTTYKQLPPGHADLLGLIGEVARGRGRGFLPWRPDDTEQTTVGADRLLAILRAGQHPLSRSAISTWLDSLPCRDPFLILDLFYLEQCDGCWGGVFPYAFAQEGRFMIFPLCHRDIIEAMLSLPPVTVRGTDLLARRIMEREWPELLDYPFNEPRGLQKIGMAVVRARRRIERKLRKIGRSATNSSPS
jgi:hypothetical protein